MRQRQDSGKSREIPLLYAKPMALVGRCNDAVGAHSSFLFCFFFVFFLLHCSWIARRPAGRASWGLLQEGFLLLGDYIKFF